MASINKIPLPGCIYPIKSGNYWWKIKLPGESRVKARPLIPCGAKFATKDRLVAEEVANELWQNARYRINYPGKKGTVAALVRAYEQFADEYYSQSSEPKAIRYANKPLMELFAGLLVVEFGPKRLKEVQKEMIKKNWVRKTINQRIGNIKRMFRWGVEEEMIPASIYHGLAAVRNLQKGRSAAKESRKIKPVDEKHVMAVLPYATPTVADMIQVQLLTGMRSTELCDMRPKDIDRSGDIWIYTPTDPETCTPKHKTAYLDEDDDPKEIAIGPKAQKILAPYLLRRKDDEYLFSPAESTAQMRQWRKENRQTPADQGNSPGTNRKENPQRIAGNQYNKDTYGRAVRRAIRAAQRAKVEVPDFHPHQLRHSAGTKVRDNWGQGKEGQEFGLQAASALLGHRDVNTTKIYAGLNKALAIEAARRFG